MNVDWLASALSQQEKIMWMMLFLLELVPIEYSWAGRKGESDCTLKEVTAGTDGNMRTTMTLTCHELLLIS